jgi:uncharacterized protein
MNLGTCFHRLINISNVDIRSEDVYMITNSEYQEIEVRFANSEINLAGTLLRPSCTSPVPAVVLIHGAGPEKRDGAGNMLRDAAVQFATHGIAALIYDKRGNGDSTGDWTKADFTDLADDALAGVRFLQTQTGIYSSRVGVWGFSQGGFIAPLAASRSSGVAFTIIVSGAAVTPELQELARVAQHMHADNFSEEEIVEAVAAMRQVNTYAQTGLGWDDLANRYKEAVNRKVGWLPYLGGSLAPKGHWYWTWWRQVMDFDPIPLCKQIKGPVLILLGELDRTVPVADSIRLYKDAFTRSGNYNCTIKVFPSANHGLRLAKTGSRSEYGRIQGYVPGYFGTLIAWVMQL